MGVYAKIPGLQDDVTCLDSSDYVRYAWENDHPYQDEAAIDYQAGITKLVMYRALLHFDI